MERKDYDFTKRVGREAYEQAIRDMDGSIIGDVDQHRHPDYALLDHEHEGIEHEHEDLQAQVEHNEDRINALEHELEALADTKEAGEWELVSLLDFDVRGQGQMVLTTDDFTASTNTLSLHSTDTAGVSHGFSQVEVGDYVEIVEEHLTRGVGDYGLYTVTSKSGNDFGLSLVQGQGTATLNSKFLVKFFHLNDNLDLADLDSRYAQKSHTHSVPSHGHNYASSSHTHDYASGNHSHSVVFRSGTSTSPSLSKGEPYLNTSYKVIYVGV